ncbi:hypothetical protein V6Z11_A12G160500 [Gossypium hirsutum]
MEKMNIPWLILSLQIFIFFSLNRQLAFGVNTISANQSLFGTQTIISSGGHLVLGFDRFTMLIFKPVRHVLIRFFKPGNSSNYYIGMWYGNVNQQTAVWVANREIPVHDIHSSELKISNGNLVFSISSNFVVAVLEDGGNLVLKDGPKSSTPLWQSLDHPTHTWLPGYPAPGLFSLELDPIGTNQYFILWNRSEYVVPEMRLNEIYNYSYIKQLSWSKSSQQWSLIWPEPRQQCEVCVFCGAFGNRNEKALPFCNCLTGFEPKSESDWSLSDFSKGCKRKTQIQCEDPTLANVDPNRKSRKFLEMPNIKLPQHEQSMTVESISECESICLKNYSCNAYTYGRSGYSSNGRAIYIRLAASEFSSSSNKSGIIIGAVAGIVGVVLCLVVFAILRWMRGTMRNPKITTNNFFEELGGGGFGSVFKGMLANSSVIAVKQLESINQGEKQFRTEVSTIETIQHENLVRLRGFCSDGARKLSVYDYMPKGSLDAHLFHESNSDALDWKTRYQIALGTARGLVYLHEKCINCIIHCDIKPENILLDAEFCLKRDFSKVLITMTGMMGYLVQEWISGVAITAKADVLITEGGDVLSLLEPRLMEKERPAPTFYIDSLSALWPITCDFHYFLLVLLLLCMFLCSFPVFLCLFAGVEVQVMGVSDSMGSAWSRAEEEVVWQLAWGLSGRAHGATAPETLGFLAF